jgi:hypothetical protein
MIRQKQSWVDSGLGSLPSDFDLVIQAFRGPAGNQFLRPEVVEVVKDRLAALAQGAGDLLQGSMRERMGQVAALQIRKSPPARGFASAARRQGRWRPRLGQFMKRYGDAEGGRHERLALRVGFREKARRTHGAGNYKHFATIRGCVFRGSVP